MRLIRDRKGQPMKPLKRTDFKPGWRRSLSEESEKPVTLPKAPWDAKTEPETVKEQPE